MITIILANRNEIYYLIISLLFDNIIFYWMYEKPVKSSKILKSFFLQIVSESLPLSLKLSVIIRISVKLYSCHNILLL